MRKYILPIISIIALLSSFFIIDSLSEYRKERNFEVVVIEKTQLRITGYKNNYSRVDSYLITQALNEVKDEAVNLNEHSFIRNDKTMNDDGSIKDEFFIKTYKNGPKFDIKVDLTTYMTSPIGTRLVFKLRYQDIKKEQSKENLIFISLFLLISSISILLIRLIKLIL